MRRNVKKHPCALVIGWVVLIAAVWLGAVAADGSPSDLITVSGSDSAAAVKMAEDTGFFGGLGLSATLVFQAEHGLLTSPANRQALTDELSVLASEGDATAIDDPFDAQHVSADRTAAFTEVRYEADPPDEDDFADLRRVAERIERRGVRTEIGGTLADSVSDPEPSALEFAGIIVALVVLVVALGSLRLGALVLLSAGAGVAVAVGCVVWLAAWLSVPGYAVQLASLVGVGVGIDYGLLLSTHRSDRLRRAVVLAAGTVMLSLGGLAVVGVSFFSMMGLATALAVLAVAVASFTLLPALTELTARRDRRSEARAAWVAGPSRRVEGLLDRILARPVAVLILGLVMVALLAAPAAFLRLGQLDAASAARHDSRRQAHDLVASKFGPGYNSPLNVGVDLLGGHAWERRTNVERLSRRLARVPGVELVLPPRWGHEAEQVALAVIPSVGADSPQAPALLRRVRSALNDEIRGTGLTAHVGGAAATRIDLSERVSSRLWLMIAFVVGSGFALLALAWRAVLLATKAAILNLLSVAAGYGVLVLVFQWGWGSGLIGLDHTVPVDPIVPVFLFAILFGISMDYEVFLMHGVLERVRSGLDDHTAIRQGIGSVWRVVGVGAALMTAVFSGFIAGTDPLTKMFGVSLTAAVLVDAIMARTVLVPAALGVIRRWGKANEVARRTET